MEHGALGPGLSAVHTKQGHTPRRTATLSVNFSESRRIRLMFRPDYFFFFFLIPKKVTFEFDWPAQCPDTDPVQHLWEEAEHRHSASVADLSNAPAAEWKKMSAAGAPHLYGKSS